MELQFFIELVTNGILTGLMYALVAVGFVLIYKFRKSVCRTTRLCVYFVVRVYDKS